MNPQLFTKRTGSIYHSQVKRFRERRNKAGKVIQPERKIQYSLDEFRKWIRTTAPWCAYCEARLSFATFCVDHNVPVGRGGSLAMANLAICCGRCNRTKGNLTGQEFRQFMKGIMTFPEAARVDILRRLKQGGAYNRVFYEVHRRARYGQR